MVKVKLALEAHVSIVNDEGNIISGMETPIFPIVEIPDAYIKVLEAIGIREDLMIRVGIGDTKLSLKTIADSEYHGDRNVTNL